MHCCRSQSIALEQFSLYPLAFAVSRESYYSNNKEKQHLIFGMFFYYYDSTFILSQSLDSHITKYIYKYQKYKTFLRLYKYSHSKSLANSQMYCIK